MKTKEQDENKKNRHMIRGFGIFFAIIFIVALCSGDNSIGTFAAKICAGFYTCLWLIVEIYHFYKTTRKII